MGPGDLGQHNPTAAIAGAALSGLRPWAPIHPPSKSLHDHHLMSWTVGCGNDTSLRRFAHLAPRPHLGLVPSALHDDGLRAETGASLQAQFRFVVGRPPASNCWSMITRCFGCMSSVTLPRDLDSARVGETGASDGMPGLDSASQHQLIDPEPTGGYVVRAHFHPAEVCGRSRITDLNNADRCA